jgi:ATP-binding protein involved in chromosome partitioning
MSDKDRANILAILNQLIDPRSGQGLVDAGLVQGLVASRGRAGFMLEVLDYRGLVALAGLAKAGTGAARLWRLGGSG